MRAPFDRAGILALTLLVGCGGGGGGSSPATPSSNTTGTLDCTNLTQVQIYTAQPAVVARGGTPATATGTVALASVVAGNTVGVAGQNFTAIAAGGTPTSTQFAVGATDADTAANLAAAIGAHATVKAAVSATASGAVVSLAARTPGIAGNYVALATSSTATVTLSGAALAGGAGTGKGILTAGGKQFRDASGDGALQPYEDWRLLEICRAKDLVARMTIPQKVGLMSEGGALGNGTANGTLPASAIDSMVTRHVRQGLVRPAVPAAQSATYINHLNELAEALPLGVPVAITADPVHAINVSMGTDGSLSTGGMLASNPLWTSWPGMLGLGAVNDPDLTWAHGDMVRREFMASGIRWQLGPMADLATEPRWNRVGGLFGSNALHVAKHVEQVVMGFQGSADGSLRTGIAATLKHFPGHGPNEDGKDGHAQLGRFTVFPGNAFDYHLIPFQAGFDVGAAAIMPNYTIQKGLYDVNPLQVPSAFAHELITGVAKQRMKFQGLVTNDWCTLGSCGGIGGNGYGMEGLTYAERAALHLHAGSHQLGNESSAFYQDAYDQGLVTAADIDAAAEKILEMSFKLGLFENPYVDAAQSSAIVRSAESRAMGFEAMKKAMVLLRNTDHLGGGNRYLPINGSRAANDANGNGTVDVYFDGFVDGLVGTTAANRQDGVYDLYGNYDYTSLATTGVLGVASQPDLARADIAVIRIATRGGSQTAGIPLSYDGVLTPEQLGWSTDGSLAAAAASKKKVLDAFRVRDGYKDSTGATLAPANPTLKIVLVVNVARPPILRPFVNGLVSLDELPGQAGTYPSVSDEANIRQAGVTYPTGGGVDALVVEFGAWDRAVLDFLFNRNVPAGFTYGSARLPMELPSTDAEVEAQCEDLPDDTWAPTFPVAAGVALPAN